MPMLLTNLFGILIVKLGARIGLPTLLILIFSSFMHLRLMDPMLQAYNASGLVR